MGEVGIMDKDRIDKALANTNIQVSAQEIGEYLLMINPEVYQTLQKDLIIVKQSEMIASLIDGQEKKSDNTREGEVQENEVSDG